MKKPILLLIVIVFIAALLSCTEKGYVDYMSEFAGFEPTIGARTNDETPEDLALIYGDPTATEVHVLPVELETDFIFGVDMSSIIEVETAGGVFYNEAGEEQDVFEILADHGVNYVRIRLWVNPFNDEGATFGGGTDDTTTGIAIAQRAARVGMRICLDFHYSDFWADPGKQSIPRAWASLSKPALVQAIHDYTYETLMAFQNAGVRPHMVQIGNEINNGFVWPRGKISVYGFDDLAEYLTAGLSAVKEVSADIRTVIHLAEGASEQKLTYFFDNIIANGVEFDIIGLSYYSFWHGPLEQFEETLAALDEKYEQPIAVMEYSYGYTDVSNEFTSNIYSSELESAGGYLTSLQGQTSYIRDVNAAVASIPSGLGTFYWEPAWLGIEGTSWASQGAFDYLDAQGDAAGLGKASWANQALFSYSGKALPSLSVFAAMRTSTFDQEEIYSLEDDLNVVINLGANETLPTTTVAYTNLDRRTRVAISWDETELSAVSTAGTYVVHGTVQSGVDTVPIVCHVEAYVNFIQNASFEDGGKVTADVKDFAYVEAWEVTEDVAGAVKVESKNPRTVDNQGSNNLNIWASSAYAFTLWQTVVLPAGTYSYSVWARSADTLPAVELFLSSGGIDIASQSVTFGSSWSDWNQNTLTFTLTEQTTVLIGLRGACVAASWAHFDDFALKEVAPS